MSSLTPAQKRALTALMCGPFVRESEPGGGYIGRREHFKAVTILSLRERMLVSIDIGADGRWVAWPTHAGIRMVERRGWDRDGA